MVILQFKGYVEFLLLRSAIGFGEAGSKANSMNAGPHQDKAPVAKVRLVKAKVAKTYDLLCARYDKS